MRQLPKVPASRPPATASTTASTITLMVTGAYYRYDQNSYGAVECDNTSSPTCSGSFNMVAGVADDRLELVDLAVR